MNTWIFLVDSCIRFIAVTLLFVCINMIFGGDASAARLAAGAEHTLAIKADGTVWAWGYNSNSQLGDGSTTSKATPNQVLGLTRIVSVSARKNVSAAVKSNGTVWAWGAGIGAMPVQVTGLTDIIAVAISNPATGSPFENPIAQSIALKSDGTVWSWGYNTGVQTTPVRVTGLTNIKAISGPVTALRSDGSVWNWGYNAGVQTAPVQVPGLTNVDAIAAGAFHTLALRSNGTVWGWGNNLAGQLGDGTQTDRTSPVQAIGLTNVKSIATTPDAYVSQAVRSDGTVWMWGANGNGHIFATTSGNASGIYTQPFRVNEFGGTTPVVNIMEATVGGRHTIALRSDGAGRGWGSNYQGLLGIGGFSPAYLYLTPQLVVTDF